MNLALMTPTSSPSLRKAAAARVQSPSAVPQAINMQSCPHSRTSDRPRSMGLAGRSMRFGRGLGIAERCGAVVQQGEVEHCYQVGLVPGAITVMFGNRRM